jgi:hypothetical protein
MLPPPPPPIKPVLLHKGPLLLSIPLFYTLVKARPLAPNHPQLSTRGLQELVASPRSTDNSPISVGLPLNQPTNANSLTPSFLFRRLYSHR